MLPASEREALCQWYQKEVQPRLSQMSASEIVRSTVMGLLRLPHSRRHLHSAPSSLSEPRHAWPASETLPDSGRSPDRNQAARFDAERTLPSLERKKVVLPLNNSDDCRENTCGHDSIAARYNATRAENGRLKEEGLMARTFVALSLFFATSIGCACPAPAQYNNPGTYQGNQGYPGGQQGGNQGYPGGQQGGYQGNQTGCPYGQQFDPRQNRCVMAAAAIRPCPPGQQFDQSQNRCVYALPGGVTVPGSLLGK